MTKPEMYLLTNAERIIQALNYKTKWEIEMERMHEQVLKISKEKLISE